MKHKSKYTIGLGKNFLLRARIIFITFFIIVFLALGAIAYGSHTSGEFEKKIAQPLRALYKVIIVRSEENTKTPDYKNVSIPTISSSQTPTTTPTPTTTVRIYNYTQPKVIYVSPTPNTFDSKKWIEEKKAANEKWAEQKRQEQNQWFQDSVSKMDADYNARVEQMKTDNEQWKKEHGFSN